MNTVIVSKSFRNALREAKTERFPKEGFVVFIHCAVLSLLLLLLLLLLTQSPLTFHLTQFYAGNGQDFAAPESVLFPSRPGAERLQ